MPQVNFPASPAIGDLFAGRAWDGHKWTLIEDPPPDGLTYGRRNRLWSPAAPLDDFLDHVEKLSFGSNSIKLPGLLIQWRRDGNGGSRWVTFPEPYSGVPNVFCQAIETVDDPSHAAWAMPFQVSATQFYIVMRYMAGGGTGHATGEAVSWIAIGTPVAS